MSVISGMQTGGYRGLADQANQQPEGITEKSYLRTEGWRGYLPKVDLWPPYIHHTNKYLKPSSEPALKHGPLNSNDFFILELS